MNINKNYPLQKFNTFKINVSAKYFVEINTLPDLFSILERIKDEKVLFLGGGSNILFTNDYDGYIVKNNLKGIKILKTTDKEIYIEVASGENWHDFVLFCVENGYSGIENLALIPGTVGASAIQNIGAYGVEVKDAIEQVKAIDLKSKQEIFFSNSECKFGYRDSIFKGELKDTFFIISIIFKLSLQSDFNIEYQNSYGGLNEELNLLKLEPSLKNIFRAVVSLRTKKLADPQLFPNAGSFFKNPIVSKDKFNEIIMKYSDCPSYSTADEKFVKLSAGWLIEKIGYKGKIENGVGTYDKHALLLVNYSPENPKSGLLLKNFSTQIINEVKKLFGIELEPEVNII